MLKPAILYKDIIEKKFAELMYTKSAFYYMGYPHANVLPQIKVDECYYLYAIIDESKRGEDAVVGYLTYFINLYTDSVERFGLISFDKGNYTVTFDTFALLRELVKKHRRVEWHCVGGNPAAKTYDKFCERYHGYKSVHHKCTKDADGNYLDSYTYEILDHGEEHSDTI